MPELRIGTSGWQYPHWRGRFYPQAISPRDWLPFYSQEFETVEVNNSFYRLPEPSAFERWYKVTPAGFLFALKGSRFITHVRKLLGEEVPQAVQTFLNRSSLLREKQGPILWQLPPSLHYDPKRLEGFLGALPSEDFRFALEVRHRSWMTEECYTLLRSRNIAWVIADAPKFPKEEVITANFVYLRFHGAEALYASKYSDQQLESWSQKIRGWLRQGLDVYAYFNNDFNAYAVENARQLKALVLSES